MGNQKMTQLDRIRRYADLIQKQSGRAVRPYRADGYVNMMTRYGTQKDSSEHYKFVPESAVPDELLTMYYEGNGLFAKIIDTPAEEAIKHGFKLKDISDQKVEDFYMEALDELDWDETAITCLKWARLFGGSLAVMLINDGRGLDEPLDWRNIRSIDDIRVFDRSVIQPDYTTLFNYDPRDPFSTRGSRLGLPEYYQVFSKYGSFTVHDSRCLVFQNGILPENTTNSVYQLWGVPEYIRINKALEDAEIAHHSAPKMLDRSVQPIYKMQNLSETLATEEGESAVLKRLQVIDLARGLLNSLVIDAEGEDYDFKTFQFSGINDVVSASCNMLSALSNIPQTILFGQAVGGMSSTDDTSMENYYNYIERIQRRMLKSNLRYLLSIIFQAGLATGEVDEIPKLKIEFNPLWSLSDLEQADLEQKREQVKLTRAQTAQIYVNMQAVDPSEVRQKLADSEEFDVESMLDEYDDDELFPEQVEGEVPVDEQGQPLQTEAPGEIAEQGDFAEYAQNVSVEEHNADPETGGNGPAAAPAATKLPQDMSAEELAEKAEKGVNNQDGAGGIINRPKESVGVLVISNGRVLSGTRHNDFGYGLVCGPGGHVEPGETPVQAAFRETEEEFGISPKELIPLGLGPYEPDTGLRPHLYLCTDYEGEPDCLDLEMTGAKFRTMEELDELAASMFQPFADGLKILKTCIDTALFFGDEDGEMFEDLAESVGKAVVGEPEKEDGGPGSGNHGHKGVPGKIGGSAPGNGSREAVTGSDISKSYSGKGDIKSVIHAQGFDGLPKVVSKKEFDDAVKKSSFVAQRTYSASSKEILDSYRDQLYNGDWYVECSVGGAQYGQGMYCAADYTGTLSDGIKAEMKHYKDAYRELGADRPKEEWISDAKKALNDNGFSDENSEKWADAYFDRDHTKSAPLMKEISEENRDKLNDILSKVPTKKEQPSYTETLTLDPSAKIVKYQDLEVAYTGRVPSEVYNKIQTDYAESQFAEAAKEYGADADTFLRYSYGGFDIPWDQYSDACKALGNDACRELSGRTGHIRSSAIQKADEYSKRVESESAEIRTKYGDIGSYAAALGYDAINAEGHGESGSYTVILNRTKTIMLDDSDRSDEEDSGLITFRPGRNGKLDAIRNGKVIGWVAVSESGDI